MALSRRLASIPVTIANAMLAGVLLPICVTAFTTLGRTPPTSCRSWPSGWSARSLRAAGPYQLALLAALVVVGCTLDDTPSLGQLLPHLDWTTPSFDWRYVAGIALPLFFVNIASQYAPGVAVMKTFGFSVPWRPTMLVTAGVSAVGAPFGGHAINLAAISAALAASPDAHPDPRRRSLCSARWPHPCRPP